MSYIHRDMSSAVIKALKLFNVVTITGPRQSGKSTLARHVFPDMPYVNMENFSIRKLLSENPVGFVGQYSEGAIFDEAQLVPELFRAMQAVVDDDIFHGRQRKFIITGSSNLTLMERVSESMAGRTAMLTLLPLSQHELVNSGFENEKTDELMFCGGYPRVWTAGKEFASEILQNYLETYVGKDVRQIQNIKDINKFMSLISLCAGRIGTELNRSALSVQCGVSVPTIDAWLSALEASYVIWRLQPWSTNLNKRLTKSPKLYFYDTGLACQLLGINQVGQLNLHPLRGAIFENLAILNLLKNRLNTGKKPRLFFYRDKTGREIDLIEESSNGLKLYELKASTGFNPDYFKHIRYFQSTFNEKIASAAVVYDGHEEMAEPMSQVINFRNLE